MRTLEQLWSLSDLGSCAGWTTLGLLLGACLTLGRWALVSGGLALLSANLIAFGLNSGWAEIGQLQASVWLPVSSGLTLLGHAFLAHFVVDQILGRPLLLGDGRVTTGYVLIVGPLAGALSLGIRHSGSLLLPLTFSAGASTGLWPDYLWASSSSAIPLSIVWLCFTAEPRVSWHPKLLPVAAPLAFSVIAAWWLAASNTGLQSRVSSSWLFLQATMLVMLTLLLLLHHGHSTRIEYLVDLRTRQLLKAQREAEAATLAKSAFLANMSHEIRTPMNGVLGMAQLLQETELTTAQRESVSTIVSSGDALLRIINEILDYSKLEAHKMAVSNESFDMRRLVKEVAHILGPAAHQKKLALSCEVESDVPPLLLGDAGKIRQILLNLAGNAIKFTEHGTVSVHVQIARLPFLRQPALAEEFILRFVVSDTGSGIAEQDFPKLFQAFSQVDGSTTRMHEGTGLGLAISKRMTELLRGEIFVQSEPGRGSQFSFELPMRYAQPAATNPVPPASAATLSGHVLIADDNRVNQMVAKRLVESLGLQTQVVSNGKDAVLAAQRDRFDLILMDIHMPIMDGIEATTAIVRALGKRCPAIIALSASALTEDVERCLSAGMVAHLSKPLGKEALLDVMQQHLPADSKAS